MPIGICIELCWLSDTTHSQIAICLVLQLKINSGSSKRKRNSTDVRKVDKSYGQRLFIKLRRNDASSDALTSKNSPEKLCWLENHSELQPASDHKATLGDASSTGIGACLSPRKNGEPHPVNGMTAEIGPTGLASY
ncbi:hypothetical protein CEXT_361661 [Caerostris extrusa]|uniref:Uncharacterized protein n=1 Tax=Caerostris extrusa TaxID=172846 RepID=A0AAV4WHN2_CAEEX|nr:hypothetical protein CEXT_361661 [Caerostris extrusa]